MTVIVAGKPIKTSAGLSELARQVLTYIDGGPQWLAWAMPNPMVSYEAADETALLVRVQKGLHGASMTLLPHLGLWVSPAKLMSLGSADLRLLGEVETGPPLVNDVHAAQSILHDNHLLTVSQLRSADAFLHDVGVAEAPVFQALDFNDRVALYGLAALAPRDGGEMPEHLAREAAAFAVQQARTLPEFCDYYQVYLVHARKMDALKGIAATREQLANQALQTLLPLAFGALDCPRLRDRLHAPAEVENHLRNWLSRGYKIGFSRLSQAVLQIVTQTIFTSETGTEAARLFELYVSTAQAFLSANRIAQPRLGQDGATLVFTLSDGSQQAQLQVCADRLLTLRQFGAETAPDQAAAASPSLSTTPQTE